jgi:hypothetical protein
MSLKVTRRQLAAALAGAATAAGQGTPTPAGGLAGAQKQLRENAAAIAKVPLAQTVDPAFTFRA